MTRSETAPIEAARARRSCDESALSFETTDDLEPLPGMLGQERAEQALRFGLSMKQKGFNLFVLGPAGMGKHRLVREVLRAADPRGAPVEDWVYVHNFSAPEKPRAIALPVGRGADLEARMGRVADELVATLRASFESEELRNEVRVIQQRIEGRQEEVLSKIGDAAEARSLRMMRTPQGLAFAPMKEGEVLDPERFKALPEEEQKQLKDALGELEEQLQEAMASAPRWQREAREELREIHRGAAQRSAHALLSDAREAFADIEAVSAWLEEAEHDIAQHAPALLAEPSGDDDDADRALERVLAAAGDPVIRYRVNLFIDRRGQDGEPVVEEDHPTLERLFGRVEQKARLGALVSDFTMIRPGAIHRANGGTLVLDARRLLTSPAAWDSLKRALTHRAIEIESLGRSMGISAGSLEPDPIPLDVKVVLIGARQLYYALSGVDPDFDGLFKVAADFSDDVPWNAELELQFARLLAGIARSEDLRPFRRCATSRIIEHASRLAGDQRKLSTWLARVCDLMREADWQAASVDAPVVLREHVRRAVDAQRERDGRLVEATLERFRDGTVMVDTEGAVVGQVNGLSVMSVGHTRFGQPNRITCLVRLGKGEIVDIERESELGGSIHSKGMLILSSYLKASYAEDTPVSLTASLVFEQSYGGVDGDSASMAELCALLSAIARVPIKQSFAITGSVNQRGQAQVIGGVNEKIEGFFEVCRERGLTGEQGVLIPAANVPHLMLREDVVAAIEAGQFAIYPMTCVDDAIARLTGEDPGERGADGHYPEGSVHGRVERRLVELAERAAAFLRRRHDDA